MPFKEINSKDKIQDIIKSAFNMDIKVQGSWGYNQESVTIIYDKSEKKIKEIEFMLATMRANLEMNMTLNEQDRYSAINIHELKREIIIKNDKHFDKVIYKIDAIKEKSYKIFIKEYKDNYLKENFDLDNHFNKRKEATIIREVVHWFTVLKSLKNKK